MPWWRIVKAARWWLIRKAIFHFYHGIINVISDDRFANYLLLSHFNVTLEQEKDKLCYSTLKKYQWSSVQLRSLTSLFTSAKQDGRKNEKWWSSVSSEPRQFWFRILRLWSSQEKEEEGSDRDRSSFSKETKKNFRISFSTKKFESFEWFRRKPWNKKLPEGPHFESRLAKRTNFLLDLKKSKFCTSF